jgi:uncharacterized protein
MLTDPWFYAAALPIVFLVGLSKGGFLPGLGLLGVPMLSLVVPPATASGILLPVLIAMDVVAVWSYRNSFSREHLMVLLPTALIGLAIGWFTASWITEAHFRVILGVIGIVFLLHALFLKARAKEMQPPGRLLSLILCTSAGFTSFISHAGGPLAQIYLQPQKLAPAIFSGTMVMCFAALNAIKVGPFLVLGLINTASLTVGLTLLPMAVIASYCGVWLNKRVAQERFYLIANICLAVVSAELLRSGIVRLMVSG